jgi:hypothetical protein
MYIVLADPTHLLSHVFSPFGSSTCTNSPYIFHPSAAALAPILHTSSTLLEQHLHQFSIHLPPFWSSTCTNSPYIPHPCCSTGLLPTCTPFTLSCCLSYKFPYDVPPPLLAALAHVALVSCAQIYGLPLLFLAVCHTNSTMSRPPHFLQDYHTLALSAVPKFTDCLAIPLLFLAVCHTIPTCERRRATLTSFSIINYHTST